MRIFHIVDREVWTDALPVGEYRPASLATEGFVHCSFAHQVAGTANLLFRGVDGLVVVELDPLRFEVVVEDSYASGTAFPHLYAAVPVDDAVGLHELGVDPEGVFSFVPDGRA
jgi:uncharacterized protein (DUF952 family)